MKKVTPIQCSKLADALRECAATLEKDPELGQGCPGLMTTPTSLILRAVGLQAIGAILEAIPDVDEEDQQNFRDIYDSSFLFWQKLDGCLSGSRYSQLTGNPTT